MDNNFLNQIFGYEVIKEELLRRGKVKQTDKGDYYIGD